ncbi:EAL domain-containing protein, partial [Escherichia coli]|nr:EAL domain-containing protein [Escherichia coli]HAY0340827.1 EAL domain-containing protein [Escherichia coli]
GVVIYFNNEKQYFFPSEEGYTQKNSKTNYFPVTALSSVTLNKSNNWSEWHPCYYSPEKKCLSFYINTTKNEDGDFFFKGLSIEVSENNISEFLEQISPKGDIVFLSANNKIITGNSLSQAYYIPYSKESGFHITNGDGDFIKNKIEIDGQHGLTLNYFYNTTVKRTTNNDYIIKVILYGAGCALLLMIYFHFSAKTLLKESLENGKEIHELSDKAYKGETIAVTPNDSDDIMEIKKIIMELQNRYEKQNSQLLDLIAYDQDSSFYINKKNIIFNNKRYLAAGMLCFYRLDYAKTIFNQESFSALMLEITTLISRRYSSCCDVLKISDKRFMLLCYKDVGSFRDVISSVSEEHPIPQVKQIYLHSVLINKEFDGKDINYYEGKLSMCIDSLDCNSNSYLLCEDKVESLWIASNIHLAIRNGEITMVYQPIIDVTSQQIIGAEALCRWHSQQHGIISPATFINIAEEEGIIDELGRFIFSKALEDFYIFKKNRTIDDKFILHVNVSPIQLNNEDFVGFALEQIWKYQINPKQICIEITETPMKNLKETFYTSISRLKSEGFYISIDDFGSGLADLKKLYLIEPNSIKIDSELTANFSTKAYKVAEFIAQLSKECDMPAIIEGVECIEQERLVKKLGFYQAQGYYYCRPIPFADWPEEMKL